MISVDEALSLIQAHAPDPGCETVTLDAAHGRTLAAPVKAKVSRPPAAVSAMDGYAVRLADVRTPGAKLTVIGEAPAGAPFSDTPGKGEAVRIFTGAPLPDGADHIVIQEDADTDGDTLTCRKGYDERTFIRPAGMDFAAGETVLEAGTRIGAAEVTIAAAANIPSLSVSRQLRVGILANGNELRPPGTELAPGEIVNSNPYGLAALIRDWGGIPVDLGVARDSLEELERAIETAPDIDIFLPVGGASVGDHDLMRPAFAAQGFAPVFGKIAVKPGKPTWFSNRDTQLVLGLPGNPASALVCAHLFLKPLLTGEGHRLVQARLTGPLTANGPREHFMRAALELGEDGTLTVTPADDQDSSRIRPFLHCRTLLRRAPGAPALKTGDLAPCHLTGDI